MSLLSAELWAQERIEPSLRSYREEAAARTLADKSAPDIDLREAAVMIRSAYAAGYVDALSEAEPVADYRQRETALRLMVPT